MKYVFSEIPNTTEGKMLVELMRKYLNRENYKMVLKGQYMNTEARKNWRRYEYGQPISMSTHLRVYVEEKQS